MLNASINTDTPEEEVVHLIPKKALPSGRIEGVGSGGTIWGSTFNLCNSAIGAGILALPYAINQAGLVLGIIIMVLMAAVMTFTLKIIVWTNRLQPAATTFEQLVLIYFGKKISVLVIVCVVIGTFGACTGFLVIIADLLTPILQNFVHEPAWLHSRLFVVLVLSAIGILPLSSLEKFHSLRFSSTLAILSVTFTVFVVVFRSVSSFPVSPSSIKLFNFNFSIMNALPLISFAFGCHLQLVPIFGELDDNHIPRRPNMVIAMTNLVCIVLYSIVGIFGYLEFPNSQQGNVLKNYSNHDHLVNVARVVLSFVIVCHYPPSNYCCRGALDQLFFPREKPNVYRRILWTFVIWMAALIVSITVAEIDVIFGLIGATANSLIVLVFPAFFLLHCSKEFGWEGFKGFSANFLGIIITGLGVIMAIFGTLIIILTQWFPKTLQK
eukprot:Phypoly_transcript_04178.p1 GENE.Phypoly_transcript_04178~~Phypoly_transcript_04178.p1  ORF type:complete len:438 (+),score=40.67 Phypoly_transcript_04178:52-1365(+)